MAVIACLVAAYTVPSALGTRRPAMLEMKTISPELLSTMRADGGLGGVEDTQHVYVEHLAPAGGVRVGNGAVGPDPGVVYQDIQGAEVFYRPGYQSFGGSGLCYVGRYHESPVTEFGGDVFQALRAPGGENDITTGFCQLPGGCSPYPGRGAGYHGGAAGEVQEDPPLRASSCSRRTMWPFRRSASGVQR